MGCSLRRPPGGLGGQDGGHVRGGLGRMGTPHLFQTPSLLKAVAEYRKRVGSIPSP